MENLVGNEDFEMGLEFKKKSVKILFNNENYASEFTATIYETSTIVLDDPKKVETEGG